MVAEQAALAGMSAAVLLVAYDEQEILQAKIMRGLTIPYPVVYDFAKETYRRWGMGRTTLARSMLSPSLSLRYLKLLLRGEPFLGLAKDMYQLGGDFVLDRQGRIVFAHRMRDNGDRIAVCVLMEKLREAAGPA